jgi:serine protease Do
VVLPQGISIKNIYDKQEARMLLKKKRFVTIPMLIRSWFIAVLIVSLHLVCWTPTHASEHKISKKSMNILTDLGQAMAEIAEAVKPSIVNISTTRTVQMKGQMNPFYDDPFFRRFFGDKFNMPKERKTPSLGSGVIVTSDGYILTSSHVIQGAEEINVTLSDEREFKGKIIGNDPMTDIGIIKIDTDNLPAIPWGNSDALRVGETVLAIGSPYGLSQTVTMGIVSAVGRANVGIADYEDFIQTDAAINPGNSGGALVNVKGELVGINTAIFSTTGGYQGIGFAVPTNMAKNVMDSLINNGKVIRGWFGVTIQPLTTELAKQFNLKDDKGALIGDVIDKSPAEKAGLLRGDVIIEYEGKQIDEPTDLRNMVANTPPGKKVEVKIIRENKIETKQLTIGELPVDMQKLPQSKYDNLLRGVTVQNLTPEIMSRFKLPDKLKGVIVSEVSTDSPAHKILAQGDVIMEVNRESIHNTKDYDTIVSRLNPQDNILLLIYRNGSSLFVTLSVK